MSECAVINCPEEGITIAGKPTPWGAWEYCVCYAHKTEIDAGADIQDNPDGRTIIITS